MGGAAFSNISEEDLFITADLLEVQSADHTGWFSTWEVPSTDDIDIQSMYSHLMDAQSSSLISELSQDTIYRLLPPSIRSCIRAFNILQKWTISKLVAPKLRIRVRQARMDLFLRAIEITCLRSINASSPSIGCGDRPCVQSFVEAILSSAVISSESWLLATPAVPRKLYGDPLALDISWILEHILELASIPNMVTTSGENGQCIINLDKRRHLCNLILNTPSLALKRSRPCEEVDRKDFERLNNIEREMNLISLDHQNFADREYLVTVTDKVYKAACITSVGEGLAKAEIIGYLVMIKASEGGGGKGIRKVDHPNAFKNAFHAVAGEILGSPIFIMKLAGQARHLEVQLLADQYGNAISLFGWDCSVQRHHHKIIEEAPVTIAKEDTFEQMECAAVRLAKLVGYVSAGTVEYLYSHGEDVFYFLELNPCLQVEHLTTEMVSGVNLPAAQLQVAMGIPLHRIRHIRTLYGMAPNASSEINFDMFVSPKNPDAGFKPSSGSLQELNFRSSTNMWGYFSISTVGGLHEFADSQFGHIFTYGEDRSKSRKNMIVALKELSICGDFRTIVEYLTENTFTTGWLDTLISNKLTAKCPDAMLAVVCGAITKAHFATDTCISEYKRILDKGQVPTHDLLKTVFSVDFIYENMQYNFTCARSSRNMWTLFLNGGRTIVGARPMADGRLLILLDGQSHSVYWREEVGALRLMVDAKTCLIEQENDPTQLRSPSPGKLVRFLVDSGDHINVVFELVVFQFVKQPGVSLEPGDILGILTLDDPACIKHAKPFEGLLPPMGLPGIIGNKTYQCFIHCMGTLNDVLEGYDNQAIMASTFKDLIEVLHVPELPYSEVNAILSALSGRIPAKLEEGIHSMIEMDKLKSNAHEFPAVRIKKVLEHYVQDSILPQDRTMFRLQLSALYDVLEHFMGDLKGHEVHTITNLLSAYEHTEKLFGGSIEAHVLKLREQHNDDLDKVVVLVLSYTKAQRKAKLVLAIIDYVKTGALESKSSIPVSLKARKVLILGQMPSYEERIIQMEAILKVSVTSSIYGDRAPSAEILRESSDSHYTIYDVLPVFFLHTDPVVTMAAFKAHVRCAYCAYSLLSIEEGDGSDDGELPSTVTWRFNLGQSHSPPLTPSVTAPDPCRQGSVSDLTYLISLSHTVTTIVKGLNPFVIHTHPWIVPVLMAVHALTLLKWHCPCFGTAEVAVLLHQYVF
ncbi:acetyl-CoA carboxylase [Suillus ampliporus]|nr:acetyl-CoA carboxylase [Suillus ampliporus]